MYADVLIEYNNKNIDQTFTYLIPDNMKLLKGMKVLVPFNNKFINGFVVDIKTEYDGSFELLSIDSITDSELILSSELLDIGAYLSEITLCSRISAYQTMLPSALKIKNQKNYQKYVTYIEIIDNSVALIYMNKSRSLKQKELLKELLDNGKILKKNSAVVKILVERGIVRETIEKIYRINDNNELSEMKVLTDEQNDVLNNIELNKENTYLLHGITGSGKTEVYIHLINKVLSNKQTALMLVPEITLSTQIVKRFKSVFKNNVAIFHSALSIGEKYDEYLKIIRGEVKIVVGTRSSIFVPLDNLGVIIMDEEHSDNFKQDTNPRYHALDIAKFRSKYNKIPLLIGSATPSLESMARANKGVYKLLELKNRIGKSLIPNIITVDMSQEVKKGEWIISNKLDSMIKDRLNKKEQIILLLNRRGHSTSISCKNCGFTHKCKNCEISLTYHKSSNTLKCHYCNYTLNKSEICPKCESDTMNFLGLGTEKLEQHLTKLYDARIVRMDTDTTSSKGSYEKIINGFYDHKYDILLGTQMVSKGLDFPNVTLVGIINADQSLNIPDFRSGEKTFSLLHQVAGRAGRGELLGDVVIQTYNPNHFTIECVNDNNYIALYEEEMKIRKLLKYPPYYYLVVLKVASTDYDIASKEIIKVKNYLNSKLKDEIILGPTMASNFKVKNVYRFSVIVKYRVSDRILKICKELDELFVLNNKCYLEIDFNPNQL